MFQKDYYFCRRTKRNYYDKNQLDKSRDLCGVQSSPT